MKFVVIGAGLSGQAAAYHLQEAGHQVQVLEAGSLPGGRRHVTRPPASIVALPPCSPISPKVKTCNWLATCLVPVAWRPRWSGANVPQTA